MAEEILIPLGGAFTGATESFMKSQRETQTSSPFGYYPSAFNPKTQFTKGIATVAKDRVAPGKNKDPSPDARKKGATTLKERLRKEAGGDTDDKGFGLYYEIHGNGPRKVIFLMGLNNSCAGWLPQVEHLSQDPQNSLLVLDNRGYGNSDTPSGLYSTSEMAKDVYDLLSQLGSDWNESRSLNLVGVSMGGMISLEMAKLYPERIRSLNLISTTSGQGRGEKSLVVGLPPVVGITTLFRIIGGRVLNMDSDDYRVRRVCGLLFPEYWLKEKCEKKGQEGKTNEDVMLEMFKFRFTFTRRQTLHGALSQIGAVITHRVSNAQLKGINEKVPRILIVTGDDDNLVNPGNSKHLSAQMPRAEFCPVTGAGHAIGIQYPDKINKILERSFKESDDIVGKGGW